MSKTSSKARTSNTVKVETVQVQDGTMPPTPGQIALAEGKREVEAIQTENSTKKKFRSPSPQDKGFVHAIGSPRMVERYVWRSIKTGKHSNGCTYPTASAAMSAGVDHEDRAKDS